MCFLLAGEAVFGIVELPQWQRAGGIEVSTFELDAGKGVFEAWGKGRDYRVFFSEFLPALCERTLELDKCSFQAGKLQWIFTGDKGGFTVVIQPHEVSVDR